VEYIDVMMVRGDLEGIPHFELPEPYRVRPYRPGDAETWRRIQAASDRFGTFPPEKFARVFGTDESVLAARQLYLCDGEGEAIGTMSAWFGESEEWRDWGRLHWVAVVPKHQGQGLARPLLTLTMNRLAELGHARAFLGTATPRLAAINLYLKFGFLPHVRSDEDIRAWRLAAPHLKADYWDRAAARVPELSA